MPHPPIRNVGPLKAVVSGGAGFLGSHICEKLLSEGRSVICIDNMVSGRPANVSKLFGHAHFTLVEADICNGLDVDEADEIWNFACPASPPAYQADPIQTMLTCVVGTRNCLELARRTGARLFQASTSEIYGDPEIHPQVEAYRGAVNPTGPRACYDEGKRAAETLCFDYHRTYGVEIKVARIFNTYGPRMQIDDGRVVSNFIVRGLQGEPLEIYGDGSQTRSLCYVDDLIDGCFRLMRSNEDVTGPFNLGNPDEYTVRNLADIVIRELDSTSGLAYCPRPIDDPMQRRPDIGLATRHIDWQPKISLLEGLQRTIAYFRGELAQQSLVAVG